MNQDESETYDKYNLNQRLYANLLDIFEQRHKILMGKYRGPFVEQVLRRAQIGQTNYNIVKESKALFHRSSRKI